MISSRLLRRLRMGGWCLAGLGGGIVWATTDQRDPGTAAGLAILSAFAGGLVVEALTLAVGISAGAGSRVNELAGDRFRPADGMVEIVPVAGVVGEGATEESPWSRFVCLGPDDSGRVEATVQPGRSVRWNPPLLGQVALISVFVGRDGRRWSAREIRAAHESLRSVGRWVEREAMAWSMPVNVGLAATYFEAADDHDAMVELAFVGEGDDFGPMEANASTKAMAAVSRVAAALGFADLVDLIAQINPRVAAEARIWLIHLKQMGRSHAIPAGDGMVDGVGLAICYAREASFPEPLVGPARVDPTTVAHELLHLCGASDKYGVPLDSFTPGQVSRRDVMRLDEERLDRLRIGRLTATEIGWAVNQRAD